ncbi:MAG: tetratricopeptide repeat protein [Terracidiphilus sp.]
MHRNLDFRSAFVLGSILLLSSFVVKAQTPPNQTALQPPDDNARDLKPVHPADETKSLPANVVPQSYALVIGIANYENLPASAQLHFPDRDAQAIYTTLISQQGGEFPANHVHMLTNSQATLANVLRELDTWLPSITAPDDRVLIYFAGHGFISGGKGYLAPYDIDLHNIAATALPMDTLGKLIGTQIKGKWKVLLTDACHSGAITPETDPTQLNSLLLQLHQSIFSLTASRDREQSFESADWGGGHGIFTYYVVQGLQGAADANGDGVVTADELAEYVHTNVREATGSRQNPTSERGSFDPNMVLAFNPDHVKAGTQPNLNYGTLVVQSNMDDTEFWLDGKKVGVVSKSAALRLPGLTPGSHTIKAVHIGYEPDGPREEMVYPGQETTVSVRILIPRRRNQAAVDLLDQGVELYKKGFEANYKKAEDKFNQAIALDPNYSEAYMYLGRVEDALWADDKATDAFQRAIAIDPDYEEARVSYAAALLDQGGLDEAVRQLNAALERQPNDGSALYLLSQAYAREGEYSQGKAAALRAVEAVPGNGEGHFWLAECERHLNEAAEAEAEYRQYLRLTNFNSGAMGNANYYLAGFLLGIGRKHHAAEQDIWREQQGQANLGLCDCEWMQKRYDSAIPFCEKALSLMPTDLWANYRLGVIYIEQANAGAQAAGAASASTGSVTDLLKAARVRFANVVTVNPDTDEASRARQYIVRIDAALAAHP